MAVHLFVPDLATSLDASELVRAKAMEALALARHADAAPHEWAPRAAAALLVGAWWAGEAWDEGKVAGATGIPEDALVRQLSKLTEAFEDDF